MTPALLGVLPGNFTEWGKQVFLLNRRQRVIARRSGVTIILAEMDDGWWRITKMHKGQILAEKTIKQLPSKVRHDIERRHRNDRRRQRSQAATGRRPAHDADSGRLATGPQARAEARNQRRAGGDGHGAERAA